MQRSKLPARRVLPNLQQNPQFRAQTQQALDDQYSILASLSGLFNLFNPTYGTTVTPDLAKGALQQIVVTDGNAFTVAPAVGFNLASAGAQYAVLPLFVLTITNSSGGAMGAVTFDSTYHHSGFSAPSNGKSTSSFFICVGTTYLQVGSWSTPS